MKPDWNKTGKQIGLFIAFYCAVFSSIILGQVFISRHNPILVSNADLIIPAITSLAYVIFMGTRKKTENPVL